MSETHRDPSPSPGARISNPARQFMATEIEAAAGREVCFVGTPNAEGVLEEVRVLARGTVRSVLALPGATSRGDLLLHNHPSGLLEPSQADLSVAADLHDAGVGFAIIDNTASEIYVVVEVPKQRETVILDPVTMADMFRPESPVAAALGHYEDRPGQRDMASYVTDVFNEGGVALLEAGTGIGKSFAYLVPALTWAHANGDRTVVSTNTINLQEQLVGKDLPLLAKALATDTWTPTFALLKGWRNYLCLSRLDFANSGQGSLLEDDRQQELAALREWAKHTNDGSLADLQDQPPPEVWDEVSAEADLCTRLECPHFEKCFVFQARREAADADVVVVNHHLLAADLAVRRESGNWQETAVLPPYRRLVLDEAHHLEDTAATHLGRQVTSTGVTRVLGRLERNGRGLIPTLLGWFAAHDNTPDNLPPLVRESLLPAVHRCREHSNEVFAFLAETLRANDGAVKRLNDDFADDDVWKRGLSVALDNLVGSFRRMMNDLVTVVDQLGLDEEDGSHQQMLKELQGATRRIENAIDGLLVTLRPSPDALTVRWVEKRGRTTKGPLPFSVALAAVPLELAPILKDVLFDKVESVVATSATLSTGGDFEFFRNRVGLSIRPSRVGAEVILPSGFRYREQCLFGVPTDLPDPKATHEHEKATADVVTQLAHASNGGMFVLFTSHHMLRRVATQLRARIGSKWPLLVQGEGSRDRLLRRFRDSESAILLGTDSFWEGVDVPGRALRALVLAKVPFKSPGEPVTAARLERLQSQGADSFIDYSLPQAALKLKQGFGRLIRTATDFGVVVLLDPRVVTRAYGEVLLQSLPDARQTIAPWSEIRTEMELFLSERESFAEVTA